MEQEVQEVSQKKELKTSINKFVGFSVIIIILLFVGGTYFLRSRQTSDSSLKKDEQSDIIDNTTMDEDNTAGKVSEMQIEDIVVGEGAEAITGSTVSVNYMGTFEDGSEFDSSYKRGVPFEFTLGAGRVIEGWDKGVVGMKVGGKRKLTIPPQLAYGEQGVPGAIPPNSTLIFEIELLEVK